MHLEVWAPRAGRVELILAGGERLEMSPADGGRHTIDSPRLVAGVPYGLSLDGGPVLPDPRSSFQPDGVEGLSQLVDDDFPWSDTGWSAPPLGESVLYELHVGTFTTRGTFDAAIARLDHLVELGVTAIEIMPVAEFPGRRGWGYDGVDLFAVRAGYGGPEGLRRLVDACHRRGLAVVLDVVYNHLGPSGAHLDEFGPYFTDAYRTPWGAAVNFDGPGSDAVRDLVIGNVTRWLRDFHLDGLRLDAIHALHDETAKHVVEELAEAVASLGEQLGRRLWLIAETDRNDPRTVRARETGGWGVDAQWSDDFHHALHTTLTGESHGYYTDFHGLGDLATALRSPFVYGGRYSAFLQRRRGRDPSGLTGEHFVVCLQNHDQVGNGARGERMSQLVSPQRLRVAVLLLLTSPYVPLLFAGEEWGASTPFLYFTDHAPELGRLVTEGRRRELAGIGWAQGDVPDPQAESTFLASQLIWEERQQGDHAATLEWYRQLIKLRRATPELGCGDPAASRVRVDTDAGWLLVERGGHLVAANLGSNAAEIPYDSAAELTPCLCCGVTAVAGSALRLDPDSGGIWRREDGAL